MQLLCPYKDKLPDQQLEPESNIKIVGMGGVGSIIARYLSVYLAALDMPLRLVFIDGDDFEDSNATRQMFDRLGNKAEVIQEELVERFADTQLIIDAIPQYVTPDNALKLIREGDIVLSALDNHKSRLLLVETCQQLKSVCMISGGNDGVGTAEDGRPERGTMGSIQVYLRHDGEDYTEPPTRRHPEIANPTDKRPDELSCVELIQSVPQLLFTNLQTAAAMLNTFALYIADDALQYEELAFDIADGLMRPVV